MLGLRKQATNKRQTLAPLPNSLFSAGQVHTRQCSTARQSGTSDLAVLQDVCHLGGLGTLFS